MTDFVWPSIAIPSYQRPGICQEKTLGTLRRLGVPPEFITIFVADEEQGELYYRTVDRGLYDELVVAAPGMGAVRRFIQMYYPDGRHVLNIDDDIGDFYRKVSDKQYLPLTPHEFETMVRLGFYSCRATDSRLWGIYPVLNALFMRPRVRVGLVYIVGAFWGVINSRSQELSVTLDDKEDFERTLKFFQADGNVVRLEAYSLKTSYYSTPGGMQVTRTPERIDESARILADRYPMLCKLNLKKKSGRTEVRLIDPKRKRAVMT